MTTTPAILITFPIVIDFSVAVYAETTKAVQFARPPQRKHNSQNVFSVLEAYFPPIEEISRLSEGTAGTRNIAAIDPTEPDGDYAHRPPGRCGYPVVVFGGKHAEVSLEADAGRVLA